MGLETALIATAIGVGVAGVGTSIGTAVTADKSGSAPGLRRQRIQEARDRQRLQNAQQAGQRSTLVTGTAGAGPAPSTALGRTAVGGS